MRLTKLALAGCAACIWPSRTASAEPLKIREGWVAPGNWASIWLQKKDLTKHFGQSYVMVPEHYVGTPPMVTALANNEVAIANLAYSTLGIAIENAGSTICGSSPMSSRTACPAIIRRNSWS